MPCLIFRVFLKTMNFLIYSKLIKSKRLFHRMFFIKVLCIQCFPYNNSLHFHFMLKSMYHGCIFIFRVCTTLYHLKKTESIMRPFIRVSSIFHCRFDISVVCSYCMLFYSLCVTTKKLVMYHGPLHYFNNKKDRT